MSEKKILLVEDEFIIANFLAEQVQSAGYELAGIADNAIDAIQLFDETNPEVIIMDIRLNGETNGIDLARTLNLKENTNIIFLTSHCDKYTVTEINALGFTKYLFKPHVLGELIDMIEGR